MNLRREKRDKKRGDQYQGDAVWLSHDSSATAGDSLSFAFRETFDSFSRTHTVCPRKSEFLTMHHDSSRRHVIYSDKKFHIIRQASSQRVFYIVNIGE